MFLKFEFLQKLTNIIYTYIYNIILITCFLICADSLNWLESLSKSRFGQAITCGHMDQIAVYESLNMEPLSEKLMYNLWYYSNLDMSIANDMTIIFKEKTKYVCDDLNFSGNRKIFNLIYADQHV